MAIDEAIIWYNAEDYLITFVNTKPAFIIPTSTSVSDISNSKAFIVSSSCGGGSIGSTKYYGFYFNRLQENTGIYAEEYNSYITGSSTLTDTVTKL